MMVFFVSMLFSTFVCNLRTSKDIPLLPFQTTEKAAMEDKHKVGSRNK
jgi:hypothetical protein